MFKKDIVQFPAHKAIQTLRPDLKDIYQSIEDLEQAVLLHYSADLKCELFSNEQDRQIAQLYFYFYTVPLLESAGLLVLEQWTNAIFWSAVHLCLCLHLRYVDYAIDKDPSQLSIYQLTKRATKYLMYAQMLVESKQHCWSSDQVAIYMQYLNYETELLDGHKHDYYTLWRRVSPLCIVGETYLKDSIQSDNFVQAYRRFVSWSLLHADCQDAIIDLAAQRITPITTLLQEQSTNTHLDSAVYASVLEKVKAFLKVQNDRLIFSLGSSNPIWSAVIHAIDAMYDPDNITWNSTRYGRGTKLGTSQIRAKM